MIHLPLIQSASQPLVQAAQIATCRGLTSALFVGISDPLPSDDAALVAYLTSQLGMTVDVRAQDAVQPPTSQARHWCWSPIR
ncbi:MAG: hypothetical protein R3A44_39005 [Caldilineaceae bacterium]